VKKIDIVSFVRTGFPALAEPGPDWLLSLIYHPGAVSARQILQGAEKESTKKCHCEPARTLVWQSVPL